MGRRIIELTSETGRAANEACRTEIVVALRRTAVELALNTLMCANDCVVFTEGTLRSVVSPWKSLVALSFEASSEHLGFESRGFEIVCVFLI